MFPMYTLYPKGGAFMLCESIGEVDENIPIPQPPMQVAKEYVKDACDDDPVLKVIDKLREVYQNCVLPLMNMEYVYNDPQVAINNLETIAQSASVIAEKLHKVLTKQYAKMVAFDMIPDNKSPEFNSNLGFFMRNMDRIRSEGLNQYTYTVSTIPAFTDDWKVRGILSGLCSRPELLNDPILMGDMAAFFGSGNKSGIVSTFSSMYDLIDCVFTKPDRMARLERADNEIIDISDIMNQIRYENTGDIITPAAVCDSGNLPVLRLCFNLLSTTLRNISRVCYDTQCDIGSITPEVYQDRIRPVLSQCVNIFAIGTMVAMSFATSLRRYASRRCAMKEYTKLILTTLKSV